MAKEEYRMYDIIPSQRTMYMLVAFSVHKQVTQLPFCITVKADLDIVLLKKAINKVIERNDALRVRFKRMPAEFAGIRQYFIPSYKKDDFQVMHFKSEKERDDFLSEDAHKAVKLFGCAPYRFILFKMPDGNTGIYLCISHVVTDALGAALIYKDILSVYHALEAGEELPPMPASFEEYIQTEFDYLNDEARHGKDREWYSHYWRDNGEPFYAGIHGHGLLDKAREKNPSIRVPEAYDAIHDKAEVITKELSAELTEKIYEFCKKNLVTPENVFMYCQRAHAAKVNYRAEDILNIFMCSRRATVKSKNVAGCLAQPMQLRVKTPETDTFTQAVKRVASCRNDLIRHMNFPYLETRFMQQKIFNYKTSQGPSCFMFSWLPIAYAAEKGPYEIDFTAYCMGRYVMPLYIFGVPEPKTGKTKMYYMYRSYFIKPNHIELLHKNMEKAMEIGLNNPDITVKELLDNLEEFDRY